MHLVSRIKKSFQNHDAIGFLTIGGITSLINIVIFTLSIEIGLSSNLAVAIGNLTAMFIYFSGLSKLFSGPGSLSSIVRFLFTVAAYYFVSIALLDALKIYINNLVWSRTIAIGLVAPVNYFAQKYFVFRK